jgi:class 3 adenylate cyclase/tetratricopeptide (TPR) repeat protein
VAHYHRVGDANTLVDDRRAVTLFAEPPVFKGQGEVLKPYVPRLLLEWVRDNPERTYLPVDGSLAFVDISGFTALTERLARKGKIGAELMRDTLDGVFRALLDEAYDWGAGLLKWGGDALLLLFDGPDHPKRACRAMWELQQTIERVGKLRVSGGTVTLRMSIGVSTGTIEFFTAGSVHRELLVAGPVATETVSIEAIADAGEIGISHRLAALLDKPCVGSPKENALLLAAPPDVERLRAPDVGPVSGLTVASCIPIAARAHVLLERSEPEHRTITAAFIDMMDTDELLARLGPVAFSEALDERIRSIQEVALRHEVPFYETDIGKGSVKALLTAGAPSSTGHDEEQVLRTLREVMAQPGVIPMRIGVNTGKVFTGDFGPPYRRSYRVFGDAINTAARVMSRAEAGQVLATEIVLERSRTAFETASIEPFKAKGKAELVRASIVGPIVGRKDERSAETLLVGRAHELQALLAALDDVRRGNAWEIELAGAAGLGKSRLVRELIDRAGDVRVLHSRCEEYETSTPYYVLRAPLRAALGLGAGADARTTERRLREVVERVEPDLVPWIPLLGILVGLELPPTPETRALDERFLRDTLADVTFRFFGSTLAGTATLFVVEDAQFADAASLDLLSRLSRAAAGLRFALFLTHSTPETTWTTFEEEGRRCLQLAMLPLTKEHAVEIVQVATDEQPLRPHEVELIAERSAGNVLFLFELLDMVRKTGTTDALPDSVEAVIAADIDRLAPPDRMVLRYASVLGATFDPDLLQVALHDEATIDTELWERLRGLVNPDPDGGMRFRNTLVRDAAYEGLPFRRRRQLHGRVAEAIEVAPDAVEEEAGALALHYSEARRHEKAWYYGRLAGDRARAVAAYAEAARFYELALSSGRFVRGVRPKNRAQVWLALAEARETAGLFDQAIAALKQAGRLFAGDPVEQARVFRLRGRARHRNGAYVAALRDTSAGLRLVEGLESPAARGARAVLRSQWSHLRAFQGHARQAIAVAEVAVREARRAKELEALARAYSVLDECYRILGEPENAVHDLLALEIYRKLGDTRMSGVTELNLGVQAYSEGRWTDAVAWYERAQRDSATAGDRQTTAFVQASLGEVLIGLGQLDEAERVLTNARRVLRASGEIPFALFTETQLARADLARGRPEHALEALRGLMEEAEGVGHAGIALEVAVYFAEATTAAGDPELALSTLERATDKAGGEIAVLAVPVNRVRAAALIALGRLDDAQEPLDSALAEAGRQGAIYQELLTLRERALLAFCRGGEPDPEELREAGRLAQLLGVPEASYPSFPQLSMSE